MKSSIFTFLLVILNTIVFAQLSSTNLPIVIVNTTSTINDTQKQATLKIIDNISGINTPTDAPAFNGMIGIKIKGSTAYPKNSYSVETWSIPTVSLDTSLLSMPSENDWVLIASYVDRSFARSILSFSLHNNMGHYAPRMKLCELLINNQYQGIYLFGEKIKRDSNRVNLSKLNLIDNAGTQVTGGYILTIDNGNTGGWTSQIAPPFASNGQTIDILYEYPDASTITIPQQNYIKSYVDSFENALNSVNFQDTINGWRKYGGYSSFMDFMIINEFSKDYEAYRKNTFLYKDKSSKLKPGPLWGNEIAWDNTTDCNSSIDTGWAYNMGNICSTNSKLAPFWWKKLATDTLFINDLKCRYTTLRSSGNLLDTVKIFSILDSLANKLNANGAITRNFSLWPILGVPLVNEPTPMPSNHAGEIANMKAFIRKRTLWLDSKWISNACSPNNIQNNSFFNNILIYPNPTSNILDIYCQQFDFINVNIELVNYFGQKINVPVLKQFSTTISLDVSQLTRGIYFLKINNVYKKVVVE